jgi:hypothetical protein
MKSPSQSPRPDRAGRSVADAGGRERGRLTGTPWNYDAAADLTRGAAKTDWLDPYMSADTPFASGGKAYDYIDRYQNPFLHEVVDTSAADLDAHAGQVRAQQSWTSPAPAPSAARARP